MKYGDLYRILEFNDDALKKIEDTISNMDLSIEKRLRYEIELVCYLLKFLVRMPFQFSKPDIVEKIKQIILQKRRIEESFGERFQDQDHQL